MVHADPISARHATTPDGERAPFGELRNAEHRELYLAGLRLAASEEGSI